MGTEGYDDGKVYVGEAVSEQVPREEAKEECRAVRGSGEGSIEAFDADDVIMLSAGNESDNEGESLVKGSDRRRHETWRGRDQAYGGWMESEPSWVGRSRERAGEQSRSRSPRRAPQVRQYLRGREGRESHETRFEFEELVNPATWKEVRYVRLGRRVPFPWLNAKWDYDQLALNLAQSTLQHAYDGPWGRRLEDNDVRPIRMRIYDLPPHGIKWAAVKPDHEQKMLDKHGKFVGRYVQVCPLGSPYGVYKWFPNGGERCRDHNHTPLCAEEVKTRQWDVAYYQERHMINMEWSIFVDGWGMKKLACPAQFLGPTWRASYDEWWRPQVLGAGTSLRGVKKDEQSSPTTKHRRQ